MVGVDYAGQVLRPQRFLPVETLQSALHGFYLEIKNDEITLIEDSMIP